MKKALVLAALVLGSSSAAMADTSYSLQARASFGIPSRGPVVRDHRYSYEPQRFNNGPRFDGGPIYSDGYVTPQPVPVINADCANWDPMLDAPSACDGYRSGPVAQMPTSFGRWTVLGTRESAVPDHQFITVEQQYSQLRVDALSGRPMFDKVAVRYMDGSTQVFRIGGRARGVTLNLDWRKAISQVVVYTAQGSRGEYTIAAS